MLKADVLVLASPIYFYSMNAQLKLALERSYSIFTELNNKSVCMIMVCISETEDYTEAMVTAMRGFICCLPNSKEGGILKGLGALVKLKVSQSCRKRMRWESQYSNYGLPSCHGIQIDVRNS